MSISSTTRKAGPYTGNGVTTALPFSFKVFSAADVRVVRTDLTGIETDLTLTTHYTIALNADQDSNPGGTVNLVTAAATGYLTTLTSQVGNLQPVVLTNNGGFYPAVINTALDRLTIMVQQVAEKVGRALTVDISSSLNPSAVIASIFSAETNSAASASAASASASAAAASAASAALADVTSTNVRTLTNKTALAATNTIEARSAPNSSSFGFRNKINNGGFSVNQRGYVSGATVGSGLYGHDRWKMAASGDTYTFSTTANKTTITIPAGKIIQQVIEGINLQSTTYTLSWEGTAQGKIGAGSYGASGITGAVTGGTNTTIEFGPGTVANVMFAEGSIATPFETPPYAYELQMCQRYGRWVGSENGQWPLTTTGFTCGISSLYTSPMRTVPVPSLKGTVHVSEYKTGLRTVSAVNPTLFKAGGYLDIDTSAATIGRGGCILETGDTGVGIWLDAEL